MKKFTVFILAPLFMLLHFTLIAQVQDFDCLSSEPEPIALPSLACDLYLDDKESLPVITVYTNVHFIGTPDGNFYHDEDPQNYDQMNGYFYATKMLERINQYLEDVPSDPTKTINYTGDAKYRFKLYSDPNNTQDLYGGIWYWNSINNYSSQYGDKVFDIIMDNRFDGQGNPDLNLSGFVIMPLSFTDGFCTLLNAFNNLFYNDPPFQSYWNYARNLMHEAGHALGGLCHSFYCDNPCDGIDLDVEFECNSTPPGNCFNSCGAGPGDNCDNWTSGSTNMMGYNALAYSMTPCQWEPIFTRLAILQPNYISLCDPDYNPNPEPKLITSANEVWDDLRLMNRDVIIEPGAMLTITCEVQMAENARIIVEPNGRLLVNGGHITSLCDGPWQGIVVIGDSDEDQYLHNGDRYQGKVDLVNDAIIENAIAAVSLYDIDNPVGTTGGIVNATKTTFKNNRQAIVFFPYTNTDPQSGNPTSNLSSFTDCDFIVDDAIIGTFKEHILMERVSGIRFRGCKFENLQTISIFSKGDGINAIDANFSLQGWCKYSDIPCSEWQPSSVKGFKNGIRATNSGFSTHTYQVDRTDFESNLYGIYSSAVNNFQIIRSTFKGGLASLPFYSLVGIYIHGGTGYTVESNSFSSLSPIGLAVGVLTRETGNDDNQIYNNSFDDIYYANLSNGDNRNEDHAYLGLHYLCNDNVDNNFDFAVPDENSFANGIAQNQGSSASPAGNEFSFYPGTNQSDFLNQSEWAIVYWHRNITAETPVDYSTDSFFPLSTTSENECINNYPDGTQTPGPGLTEVRTKFSTNAPLFDARYAQRAALIDDGDTQSLVSTIENYQSGAGAQMKSDLLALSPYLSSTALKAAADRDDILSNTDIYDIMAANPDESIQEELLNYLETKSNPLPASMVTALRNQTFQATARTNLESEIAQYAVQKESAANFILHHFLTDTTDLPVDSILYWLDNKGGLTSEYIKVDVYLHENRTSDASQQLSLIAQNHNFSAKQYSEHNYFADLKALQIGLIDQGKTIHDFNTTELQELIQVAENSEWLAGQQAQNILNYAYGHDTIPDPIFPQFSGGARLEGQNLKENEPSTISAFPNPADNIVTFQYALETLHPNTFISVFDSHGRMVKELPVYKKQGFAEWHTKEVKAGIYIYNIRKGKHVLGAGQVVITH